MNLRKMLVSAAGFLAVALLAIWPDTNIVEATSFAVSSPLALVDSIESPVSVADPYAPGAAPDIETHFVIDKPHSNFQQVFTFGPVGSQVAQGSTLPPAAVLGRLTSETTLGLLNNPCGPDGNVTVTFVFVNGSTNNSAGNLIYPLAPTTADPLLPLAEDDGVYDDNGDGIETAHPAYANNGIADGVDAYPSYLNEFFDPDETADPFSGQPPLQPWARYVGITKVSALDVVLQFMVFKPGDLFKYRVMPNHPFTQMTSAFGFATTVVLNDPTVPPAPSSITDFCSPLDTTTFVFGTTLDNECTPFSQAKTDAGTCPNIPNPATASSTSGEGGSIRASNPAAGKGMRVGGVSTDTHLYGTYVRSFRDIDNDGKENQLDSCPFTSDAMDPRSADPVNDPDGDGIASACDPTPTEDTGLGNHDGDTGSGGAQWKNRQDNCPLVPNSSNHESELDSPYPTDGGPRADGIGDECDTSDFVGDGHYHVTFALSPVCIKSSPNGGAFYCPDTLTGLGGGASPEHLALHNKFWMHEGGKASNISPATNSPAQSCDDGVNNDGDASSDAADSNCSLTLDTDGDGFSNNAELKMGTDPRYACSQVYYTTGDVRLAGHDARPQDVFVSSTGSRVTDFQDMNALVPQLGKASTWPDRNRFDLFPSASVDFQDLNAIVPHLGKACTP